MKRSFADLGVPAELATTLAKAGIRDPFPIQSSVVPPALAGRDLCGRAPTGSGKTLAFAIPVAALVAKAEPRRPRALVLTPTRELASQVQQAMQPLARARSREVASFYGGTDLRRDVDRLRRGVDVAVATPGRLADLVQRGAIDLRDVDIVVVDEADRMSDMGFLPEVRRLLDQTSPTRQTLLFSATLDGDVEVLVRRYQRDPVRCEIEADASEAGQVTHLFWPSERADRRRLTADIVRAVGPAIVFARTKRGADRLAKQLAADGIAAAAIHGDRTQRQRERALQQFMRGHVTTLVATDVAARGIHVDEVGVVVHFDLPGSDKDYVHRSGRTGRAGARGVVVSLVGEHERGAVDAMQRSLGMARGLHLVGLEQLTAGRAPAPERAPRKPGAGRPRSKRRRHSPSRSHRARTA